MRRIIWNGTKGGDLLKSPPLGTKEGKNVGKKKIKSSLTFVFNSYKENSPGGNFDLKNLFL
jgi:hypothetical protein